MKKIMLAFLFVMAFSGGVRAGIGFTVHVTSATTFEVWMTPDVTVTTGPAGISSLGLTFETPSTVNVSGSPSPSTGLWGAVSNPAMFPSSPALLSTQFRQSASGTWESNFNWNNGTGAANQTFNAGTEYLLASFTVPSGLQVTDITVKDWGSNRVDNSGAPTWGVSLAMGTAPDGVENPATLFYASAGSTGTPNNSGAVATSSTLPLSNVILPLNFLSFDAVRAGGAVLLNWKTSDEVNVKGFRVQRSGNGADWTDLGFVGAHGGTGQASYGYTDEDPADGRNYYRIAEQDLDGGLTYTGIRIVQMDDGNSLSATIFPIPSSTTITITTYSPVDEQAVLQVLDMQGRIVRMSEVHLVRGKGVLAPVDISRYAAGAYNVEIRSASARWSGRFIKK